ncbi:putative polyadenylate-binding protein 2 [Cocos nucifera]|uniref:Putative polyadenylate-binding protein 2 n=1 Tax=Cocos nucifera TaxID=13894 RepID=A0A8K0IIY8_COCNU|nr:putative polyadenylate-binding protein 2 [Cocos nucifera]
MDPPKQQEEENDIYSVDILEETIMEADEDTVTVKNEPKPTDSKKILEDVAKRLRELNEEASILKEKKASAEKALGILGGILS